MDKKNGKTRRIVWAGFVALGLLIFMSNTSFGQIFNVSDETTLKTALNDASTNGEDDTIYVAAGTYDIS